MIFLATVVLVVICSTWPHCLDRSSVLKPSRFALDKLESDARRKYTSLPGAVQAEGWHVYGSPWDPHSYKLSIL